MTDASIIFHPDVDSDLDGFLPRPAYIRRKVGELYQRLLELPPDEPLETLMDPDEVVDGARLFSSTHEGDDYSIVAYVAQRSAGVVVLHLAYVDSPDSLAQARTLARERLLNL